MSLGFNFTPSGTVSGGAVAQIMSVGIVDTHLTGGTPEISFWRSKIRTHFNFALEVMSQSFMGNINWGGEASMTASKTPDLYSNVFLVINRPGITAQRDNLYGSFLPGSRPGARGQSVTSRYKHGNGGFPNSSPSPRPGPRSNYPSADHSRYAAFMESDSKSMATEDEKSEYEKGFEVGENPQADDDVPDVFAHWVNDLGHAAISRISVSLAGVLGQMLSGRFISAFAELTGTAGKEQDLLIGREDSLSDLIKASAKDARLYVQIPFTFTRYTGRALPAVSMRFHGITISLQLAPLSKLIKVSHPDVTVVKTSDGQPITKADVEAHLDMSAVFLDLEERKKFANGQFSMIFEQMQTHEATYKGSTIRAPLNFNHPSRCLIFMVQRKALDDFNCTFDYSAPVPDEDPIQFARLVIQTTSRFAREGEYFRKVVPFMHFPRTLKKGRYLYAMSFGLDPTTEDTNGTLNFSRIDSSTLNLDLHPSMSDDYVTLFIFNVSVNIVSFKRGMCSIEYA